jgi:hypothetical protein
MTAPVQNAASTGSARRSTPNEDEARRGVAAAVETSPESSNRANRIPRDTPLAIGGSWFQTCIFTSK